MGCASGFGVCASGLASGLERFFFQRGFVCRSCGLGVAGLRAWHVEASV